MSLGACARAAGGAEQPQVCHVGKWVHLNQQGAWLSHGSPAVLTQAAVDAQVQGPDWVSAHTVGAYCKALQKLCASHGLGDKAVDGLLHTFEAVAKSA